MFTCIFAMARTIGWIAQWNEMISDPEQKIGRPRQLFVGSPRRDVPRSTSADCRMLSACLVGRNNKRVAHVSRLPGVIGGGQRGPRSKALRAGVGGWKRLLLHVSNKKANPLGFAFL
jgi:hypothetical protein